MVLDAPDVAVLAPFYSELLGWEIAKQDDEGAALGPAGGVAHARELGAEEADFQPQENVRVLLDPAGHPFCLYT